MYAFILLPVWYLCGSNPLIPCFYKGETEPITIYIVSTSASMVEFMIIFVSFFLLRTRLEPICITCIICSVFLTFYFSLMSQIISEIYFDCKIKSMRSTIFHLSFPHLDLVRTNMYSFITGSVLLIFHFSPMSQIISEIYFNCKLKSMCLN